MKVVILCGGMGTRLREETEFRPKPLVNVGDRPIIWHIMQRFRAAGYSEFVLCLGYRGWDIKEYFLNYEAINGDISLNVNKGVRFHAIGGDTGRDFTVELIDTGADTMTGGRLARIRHCLNNEPCIVTYGDGLADIDLQALTRFHRSHGKMATVTAVRVFSRYGTVRINQEGRVESFLEKPKTNDWISAGFFMLQPEVFDLLEGDDCILEKAPMETLAARGDLMAYRHNGFFFSMDTYRDFVEINRLWHAGERPWLEGVS